MRVKGSLAFSSASAGLGSCPEGGSVFPPSQGILYWALGEARLQGAHSLGTPETRLQGRDGGPWPRAQSLEFQSLFISQLPSFLFSFFTVFRRIPCCLSVCFLQLPPDPFHCHVSCRQALSFTPSFNKLLLTACSTSGTVPVAEDPRAQGVGRR